MAHDFTLDLEVVDGKTYTRPGSLLRRAETRHMLNGFVTRVVDTAAELAETLDTQMPRPVAEALVAHRDALRMNYRIVTIGRHPHLLGRPIREDA